MNLFINLYSFSTVSYQHSITSAKDKAKALRFSTTLKVTGQGPSRDRGLFFVSLLTISDVF